MLSLNYFASTAKPVRLLFLDASIQEPDHLIQSLESNVQIFRLPADKDGFIQISNVISNYQAISEIHILFHGLPGKIQLGTSTLTLETLDNYTDDLHDWSYSLTDDADILFYGCHVAANEEGRKLIHELANLTGANVAASTDFTGSAALGGNWNLEYRVGSVDTTLPTTFSSVKTWNYVMGANSIDLSTLDGKTGFRIDGVNTDDWSGWSVSDAGDMNGDGFSDLLIGALGADPGGSYSGASYVVFGSASGFSSTLDLSTLNGNNGFRINGTEAFDYSGRSVSGAGDINGDGFDDIIIGAMWADPNGISKSGASYVIFGKSSHFDSSINLSSLDGTNGFRLNGVNKDDLSGWSVSGAGDVNGDGFDDLLIGAKWTDHHGTDSGSTYVVFGHNSEFNNHIDLSTLDGSNGFRIDGGNAHDFSGYSVNSAGDINGDGHDDILIGAPGVSFNGWSGKVDGGAFYVIYGKDSSGFASTINLANLNYSDGFIKYGMRDDMLGGAAASSAGDVNGDGYDDLILGQKWGDLNGLSKSGFTSILYGSASGISYESDLSGAAANDLSGFSVSGAGDFNGDGFSDILIGAKWADTGGDYSGASYLVFGSEHGITSIDLSTLDGTKGFRLDGATKGDYSGVSVSAAGDVNGDGFDDIIIGADGAKFGGNTSGASYVVFGSNYTNLSTVGQTIEGTPEADTLRGGLGNDTIIGNGGADILIGANGDDILSICDNTFKSIDGGGGIDTLRLDGSQINLDLTANGSSGLIDGIELIDLQSGIGNHFLKLDLLTIGQIISGTSLRVMGDGMDTISIGNDWNWQGQQTVDNNLYNIYHQGAMSLLLDTDIIISTGNGQDLSSLSGVNGFRLLGVENYDETGRSVSNAGDINGDGYDDLIIGAPMVDTNGNMDSGASYIIFGKASGFSSTLNLDTLNGSNGLRINGVSTGDNSGWSVSSAGDVNGDGFDDLIIGAYHASPDGLNNAGSSYVVFGHATGFTSTLDLSTLNGNNGFRLDGATDGDNSGRSVSSAGDINNDGYDDLIIGTPLGDINEIIDSGAVYIVYGKSSGFSDTLDLSTLNGNNGFQLNSSNSNDHVGFTVSNAGDVNGDRIDDLLVGSWGLNPEFYVLFGKTSGLSPTIDLSTLDGTNGFRLDGVIDSGFYNGYTWNGQSISSAGDINGDNFDDIIIGSPGFNGGAGASYVVFGKASFSANVNLATLDGTNGFRIDGVAPGDHSGESASGAGDVNGDGFDDLLIGAHNASTNINFSGASYLIFGKASGFTSTLNLSTLNASSGLRLNGTSEYGDQNGVSVSNAGDINGDGFDDIIIGAPYAEDNGMSTGASYVLFGSPTLGKNAYTPTQIVNNLHMSSDTGISTTDFVTNVAIQTITATLSTQLESGDILYGSIDDGTTWTNISNKVSGTSISWNNVTLAESGTILFKVTNAASYSTTSGNQAYVVDTTEPIVTIDPLPILTADNLLTGTLESGATLNLSINGTPLTPTVVGSTWSYTLTSADIADTMEIVASATDTAGNTSDVDASGSGSLVTLAPTLRVVSDFNGDGKSDILWQHSESGQLDVWAMDGTNTLNHSTLKTVADLNWQVSDIGDFDGNGIADILWQNSQTGEVQIWTDGDTTQANLIAPKMTSNPAWKIAGSSDFNGDGKTDILWHNSQTGQVNIWAMDGATRVNSLKPKTMSDLAWEISGTNDFNGDGKADILWHNTQSGKLAIWTTNGISMVNHAPPLMTSNPSWKIAGVNDFNGDGKADILWYHTQTGNVQLWTMDGATKVTGSSLGVMSDLSWNISEIGDYNGDGQADILWHNNDTGAIDIWTTGNTTSNTDSIKSTLVNDLSWKIVPTTDETIKLDSVQKITTHTENQDTTNGLSNSDFGNDNTTDSSSDLSHDLDGIFDFGTDDLIDLSNITGITSASQADDLGMAQNNTSLLSVNDGVDTLMLINTSGAELTTLSDFDLTFSVVGTDVHSIDDFTLPA
ncbi:MAG: DUF4347 domain-containing protein [Magnetococcus sp. DMHC-6]